MSFRTILTGVIHQFDASPDGELLTRYAQRHDEGAFAALVRRYGGLVLGVARRQLADRQQAEDVFQATFLALARAAERLDQQTSLANWLYTVALRQARKARVRDARRADRERMSGQPRAAPADPLAEISGREMLCVIDEEVARLPERYRLPVLLCCVQGLAREDAAGLLGWSAGALRGRLERGRRRLMERLTERGLAPSLLLPLTAGAVPGDLATRTAALAAAPWTASLPAAVATLAATGVPRRLTLPIALAGALLVAGLIGLAVGLGRSDPAEPSPPPSTGRAAPVAAGEGPPLASGEVRRFGDQRFRVTGMPLASALSADGRRLAVLSSTHGREQVVLAVLDTDSGRTLSRATAEAQKGTFATPGLAFSPDGRYIAAVVNPQTRAVWNTTTGKCVTNLPAERSGYSLCRFTADGLLALGGDGQTILYEIPSGKVAKSWPVGGSALLSPDMKTFVRIEQEFTPITLGDTASGKVTATLDVKTANNGMDVGLAFSDDGKKLAIVHDRKTVQVWDVATRTREAEAPIPADAINQGDPFYTIALAPDGATIVLATKRGEIYRWETRSLKALPPLRTGWATYIRGVHWAPDGKTILAAASTGLVARWDATTGRPLPDAGYNSRVQFAVTADGSRLVVGDRAGRIDVWDAGSGKVMRHLDPGRDPDGALRSLPAFSDGKRPVSSLSKLSSGFLTSLAVSRDGKRVAAGDGGGGLRLYAINGGDGAPPIVHPRGPRPALDFVCWAPDGATIFAADEKTICRLAAADGKPAWEIPTEVHACALTPDGRFLFCAMGDMVTVRKAATGKEVRTFRVAIGREQLKRYRPSRALAFTPDGERFALTLGEDTVGIFDLMGREFRRFVATDPSRPLDFNAARFGGQQPLHRVEALAFTPDGKWLVSGADDLAVKVWEVATGKLVRRFDGSDSTVQQVAVSPDGRSAFSAGGDGFVAQWDLTPGPYPQPARPEELWSAAAGNDPATAVPAAWALVSGAEEMRTFVVKALPPADRDATEEQLAKWLADLDAPAFADREAATKALAVRGRMIEPQLRAIAGSTASAEVRRRVEQLLARFEGRISPDELRVLRLIQSCELSATPAARALLRRWAGGAAGAVLTDEAKAALTRLDHRAR